MLPFRNVALLTYHMYIIERFVKTSVMLTIRLYLIIIMLIANGVGIIFCLLISYVRLEIN